ncbi:hypothetical protein PIB30_031616 [Stylosanthes scabra]|uniref:Uncharacterized protein n=1 Tax=Stylosanthes scabra TaxID=79078 RepID=A0ABU6UBC6_9FABA|nr:hypothetical protein [Stylosanthes scabra]
MEDGEDGIPARDPKQRVSIEWMPSSLCYFSSEGGVSNLQPLEATIARNLLDSEDLQSNRNLTGSTQ